VSKYTREVGYQRTLEEVLQAKGVPYTLIYAPGGRSIKVIAAKLECLITMQPLSGNEVRLLIIGVGHSKPVVDTVYADILLKQKLYKFISAIEE
jgi:hypothetical protein